ncbi:hypothetical protein CI109_101058 [Kwoniella shandongensis]|uniref:Uncharacterized protein n=1 Tax=Kwoniella shandongensis TaxID=1734106 RepID=A0A5M6C8N0_9TREE|nr:uncharacterized protein CI109_001527 [Kwoniella shandongensis]KAA5530122.1 hypothetical protein CI109_001527 [Kwoniella shandongensis]
MSNAPTAGYDVVKDINFTGGFPTSKDLAPSIVFLVAYIVTVPLLCYRLARREDRAILLLRPTIFVGARIAMLVLRIVMTKSSYGVGTLIAELVLTSVGYLFLIDPYVESWKRHVQGSVPRAIRPYWVKPLAFSLWVLLFICIIVTTISGALVSRAFDSQSWLTAIRGLRHAAFILSLAVVLLLAFVIIFTHFYFALSVSRLLHLLIPTCCLIVVAVFRVVQSFTTNPDAPVRSVAAFYVLQLFFEFVAYMFIISVSLPKWYPGDVTHTQGSRTTNARDLESGLHGDTGKETQGYSQSEPQQPRWTDRLLIVRLFKYISNRRR